MEQKDFSDKRKFAKVIYQEREFSAYSDSGVFRFGEHMGKIEDQLRQDWIENPEADQNKRHSTLLAHSRALNESWPYRGDTATVSGKMRLFVKSNSCDIKRLEHTLQQVAVPNENDQILFPTSSPYYASGDVQEYSCTVYQAKLTSLGVMLHVSDGSADEPRDINALYRFGFTEDKIDDVLLFAEPDQLLTHVYESPTFDEVCTRLKYQWPQSHRFLKKCIREKDDSAQHDCVRKITDALASSMVQDAEFRQLAENFVNVELALNLHRPYRAMVDARIDVRPATADDDDWSAIELEDTLEVDIYRPYVEFVVVDVDGQQTVKAQISGETFNEEYGDDTSEQVRIDVASLTALRPSWRQSSLATIALRASSVEPTHEVSGDERVFVSGKGKSEEKTTLPLEDGDSLDEERED